MCKISIILPVYNGADHIAEAIESVLLQTFPDFELIIVNDCSTDNTAAIVRRYEQYDRRIRVINNGRNLKLPASLNIGFQKASGEYLTWTSHDNRYRPNALACMLAALEADSRCGLVYADYSIIDQDGIAIRENPMDEPDALRHNNVVGACFLYRKDVAAQVGDYDTDMFLAEDYDYWLRISQYTKLKHLHQNLYLYRCHNKSLSSTKLEEIKTQTVRLWLKHFDFLLAGMSCRREKWQFFDTIYAYASAGNLHHAKMHLYKKDPLYGFHIIRKEAGRYVHALLHQARID